MMIMAATGVLATGAFAQVQQAPPSVGIAEHLGQTVPLDEEFYDETGHLVPLRSVINKPTIVTFVYYRCPGICSPLLSEVAKIIDKMDLMIGRDYQVFTLSFDPGERPEMASEKRQNYLSELKTKIDPAGWRFFTGDSANIRRLTDAAGFYYQRSGRDWVHAASLIVLSPDGKITRYLYGIQQLPFDVKMALTEASEGRTGPTIAKILRFCYAYDPEGRTYTLAVTRIAGVIVLGFAGLFVAIFVLRPKKRKAPEV